MKNDLLFLPNGPLMGCFFSFFFRYQVHDLRVYDRSWKPAYNDVVN